MQLRDLPSRIKRRYSLRIGVALLFVVLVTVAIGGLFFVYTSGELGPAAESEFMDHTVDRAETVDLWMTANSDLAAGLAASEAVASGDQNQIEQRLTEAAEARSGRVTEIHYLDDGGEVLASSTDAAVGEGFQAAAGASLPASGDGPARTGVHDAFGSDASVMSFVAPASDGGYVAVSVATDSLATHLGDDGRAVLVDGNEKLFAVGDAGVAADGQMIQAAGDGFSTVQPDGTEQTFGVTAETVDGNLKVVSYDSTERIYAAQNTAISGMTVLLFVFLVHLGLIGIVLGGNVSLALRQLAEKAERIGAGEFDVDLQPDREDEVGTLYDAFADMRDSLQTTLDDLEEQRELARAAQQETEERNERLVAEAERFGDVMASCADGDLRQRLDPETDNEAMESIATSFNQMLDAIEDAIGDVKDLSEAVATTSTEVETSADEVRQASEAISASIQEISDGATNQSEDLEVAANEVNELSATIEEVASTTGNIAEQSDRVSSLAETGQEIAGSATEEMDDAESRAGSAAQTIHQLNEKTEQIGEIISLIDEIARQTDILALNAAIEAAQFEESAGGGNSGFNVVADEVKELAEETRSAVGEIEETLQTIQEQAERSADEVEATEARIESATEAVTDLSDQLDEITGGIRRVDEGVQEIDRATDDGATSAQELATIVEDVASVAGETAAQAEDAAASSEEATATINEVSNEARELDQQADRLAEAVDLFSIEQPPEPAVTDGGDRR
ncbi:chemotaxis protein [Halobacteriales archaeon QS_1_68_20]|nr:MAG: chemotaxis protein [Halobacteriales archaeon QS_1_68_20]